MEELLEEKKFKDHYSLIHKSNEKIRFNNYFIICFQILSN